MIHNHINSHKIILLFSCLSLAVLMTSCASEGQRLMSEGASPVYAQGFDDGCSSGKKAGGAAFKKFHKNVRQYQNNADYRQGWDDGHDECKNEQENLTRKMQLSVEQQRAYDEHQRTMKND